MPKNFYSLLDKIDNYLAINTPSAQDATEFAEWLREPEYAKYAFGKLDNPNWVELFHDIEVFRNPPAPHEDSNNPGYFSMPVWYAGEYLKRMAAQFPEIVKNVALNLETDNSRAIRTIIEAVLEIPPEIAAETVEALGRWAETPFVGFMMLSHELGVTMEHLAKGGQPKASLEVLEVLAEPVGLPDTVREEKIIASTKFDFYWLKKTFDENLPVLIEIDPIGVVNVLENQLTKAIGLEYDPKIDDKDKPLNSFWRLNISPRGDLNYRREFKNLLVNTIILGLDKACDQKQKQAPELLASYIVNNYSILRRIGVYTLRKWGKQYSSLTEEAYRSYVEEPILAGQSEFERFVDEQFGNLPSFAQKEILTEIRRGPDSEWIDELIKNYPDQFEGNTTEEKRVNAIETWQLKELNRIAAFISGEDKALYESLLEKHDEPEPRPEEGVVITSWEGPESPIEFEGLAEKTLKEVVNYLSEYTPPEDSFFGGPSREGLGRTFETDVQARAGEYAVNASLFLREDLHFVFHYHFFKGLEIAIKNKEAFPIDEVIALCEHITETQEDAFIKERFEPDLIEAKLASVKLIEAILRTNEPNIENSLLDRIGKIIISLLNQDDRLTDKGPEEYKSEEEYQKMDPATRSLNSVRGMAMHCLFLYGLYCERKRKKEEGKDTKPVLIPLVKDALSEKFDKKKDPSLAVHAVMGWYLSKLIYLDRGWSIQNLDQIFPVDDNLIAYWRAAWSAYIRFSDVYTNVFPELISQYQRALKELPDVSKEQGLDRVDRKVATHILKAYLLGMIELDSDDELMFLYYQNADDEARSHGNFWLSKALEAQKPTKEDARWIKIWELWQWRLAGATAAEDQNDYIKEIADFLRMLKNVPLELPEMHSVLQQSLSFMSDGYHLHLIIDYLGENCERHPELAVSLLHRIKTSGLSFYMTTDTRGNVEKILKSAITADKETKNKAVEIINTLGEQGDYSWRALLDDLT